MSKKSAELVKIERVHSLLKELKQNKVYSNFAALELYQALHDTASQKEKAIIMAAVHVRKRRLQESMAAQVGKWQEKLEEEDAKEGINGEIV